MSEFPNGWPEFTASEKRVIRDALPLPATCQAVSRRVTADGSRAKCGQPTVLGTTVCRYHGGNAPQVRAKAAERIEDALRKMYGLRDSTIGLLEDRVVSGHIDTKDAISLWDKLVTKIELLEGRATERTESRHMEAHDVRAQLQVELARVGDRVRTGLAAVEAAGVKIELAEEPSSASSEEEAE